MGWWCIIIETFRVPITEMNNFVNSSEYIITGVYRSSYYYSRLHLAPPIRLRHNYLRYTFDLIGCIHF